MKKGTGMRELAPGVCVCVALTALFCALAWAHPGLDEQIAAASERIAKDPERAELFLGRGHLHRLHEDWSAAEADYLRARALEPDLAEVDYLLGKLDLERGRPEQAKRLLDLYLAQRPDHVSALVDRGRCLVRLDHHLDAAADFGRALEIAANPGPGLYMERAKALAAAGDEHLDEAVRGLDAGLARLDRPVTLELLAVELELERNRFDPALVRLDRLAAESARPESWLVRKAEILESAGRPAEAVVAYEQALEAIRSLRVGRRQTRAVQQLESSATDAILRLGPPSEDG